MTALSENSSIDLMRLPAPMQAAVEEFKREHPEYATPEGARDKCGRASAQFCDVLMRHGYSKRDVYADEIAVVNDTVHRVATCAGYWFDWTARQFDPNAPWPAIGRDDTPWTYADHLQGPSDKMTDAFRGK